MSYEVEYGSDTIRALCEQRRLAMCKFGERGAKKLARRVKELESSPNETSLQQNPGRWHPIPHDWPGCLGAHLDGAATIIVRSITTDAGAQGWRVEGLGDCYKH